MQTRITDCYTESNYYRLVDQTTSANCHADNGAFSYRRSLYGDIEPLASLEVWGVMRLNTCPSMALVDQTSCRLIVHSLLCRKVTSSAWVCYCGRCGQALPPGRDFPLLSWDESWYKMASDFHSPTATSSSLQYWRLALDLQWLGYQLPRLVLHVTLDITRSKL